MSESEHNESEPVADEVVSESAPEAEVQPQATEKTFTQEDLNKALARQKRKFNRQNSRKPEGQEEKTASAEPSPIDENTIAQLAEDIADFREIGSELGMNRKQIRHAMRSWKQEGKPDPEEYLEGMAELFGVSAKQEIPTQTSSPEPAPTMPGASPRRDPSQITDPSQLTKDDIRRMGAKKAREIAAKFYANKGGGTRTLFRREPK